MLKFFCYAALTNGQIEKSNCSRGQGPDTNHLAFETAVELEVFFWKIKTGEVAIGQN